MVERNASVPEGVERILESRLMTVSVFFRYRGAHDFRALREGGDGGVGIGMAFSGEVSGAGIALISDIMSKAVKKEESWRT